MLSSLYHIEGYIEAQKDTLKYLDDYLNIKRNEAEQSEFLKIEQCVKELKTYFNDVKENYSGLLKSQRNIKFSN